MVLFYILIGLALGGGISYLVLRPRLKIITQKNQEIEKENQYWQDELTKIKEQYSSVVNRLTSANEQKEKTEHTIEVLEAKRTEIQKSLELAEEQAKKSYETYCEQQKQIILEQQNAYYDGYAADFQIKTARIREEAQQEYLEMLKEQSEYFQKESQLQMTKLAEIEAEIADLQAKEAAIIEAKKREVEMNNRKEYYSIQVSGADLYEIDHLRKVIPLLRNARPVCKIIWESYYRNPTSDMIGRVLGGSTHTGIYKITHPDTGMAYVGQAVNVSDRLKEHIKCGLGIDTPASKLYAAMQKYGVENFTFELLEDCPRSQLNEREKYYIELYHTQEWGWNQTKGGSALK